MRTISDSVPMLFYLCEFQHSLPTPVGNQICNIRILFTNNIYIWILKSGSFEKATSTTEEKVITCNLSVTFTQINCSTKGNIIYFDCYNVTIVIPV